MGPENSQETRNCSLAILHASRTVALGDGYAGVGDRIRNTVFRGRGQKETAWGRAVSIRDRDFIKRYLSGEHEATAKMKTLHAAAHR